MKIALLSLTLFATIMLFHHTAHAQSFGSRLCQSNSAYYCYLVKRGDTWQRLFPDEYERDIVMRINRVNIQLRQGQVIAIPENSSLGSHMDYSPFPPQVQPLGRKTIIVDFSDLAFGAYNEDGTLEHWGPISAGKGYCADVGRGCSTPKGSYTIYRKLGAGCRSSKFPVGKGGAPMPYCMFFKGGFALHGSPNVPGYNDSHGCVRLYTNDAQWLNQEFTSGSSVQIIIRQ